jgi:hypothetical protein
MSSFRSHALSERVQMSGNQLNERSIFVPQEMMIETIHFFARPQDLDGSAKQQWRIQAGHGCVEGERG